MQALEDRFFEDHFNKAKAWLTYADLDFEIFTEARWIQNELRSQYGRTSTYIPNKQELPKELPNLKKGDKKIVLVEGNIESPKKGVREAWNAIKDLDCEKWLLTNSVCSESAGGFDKVFSKVSWKDALAVIKAADILLKPSHLEGSPTPHMEAMELGTAIITTNCTGVEEYCIDDYNCLVVGIGDAGRMKDRVRLLLNDEKLRQKLIKNGMETAQQFNSWKPAIQQLDMLFNWKKRMIENIGLKFNGK